LGTEYQGLKINNNKVDLCAVPKSKSHVVLLLKDIIVVLCSGSPVQTQAEWSNIFIPHQTRSADNKVSAAVEGSASLL